MDETGPPGVNAVGSPDAVLAVEGMTASVVVAGVVVRSVVVLLFVGK
jgi:hypothetical protein